MKDGTCPKCNMNDVHCNPEEWSHPYSGISIGFMSSALLHHAVCVNCGYVELYILDKNTRQEIARRWVHVEPEQGEGC